MKPVVFEKNSSENPAAILLVGLGDLSALSEDFRGAFPRCPILTSRTAAEGLARFEAGRIFVQPVYLLPGFEYERFLREVSQSGKQAVCGAPLLSSRKNLRTLADLLCGEYAGQAVLFAGHGSHHPAGRLYADLARALREAGLAESFVGVLEGEPDFASAAARLVCGGIREVSLVPLMLALGRHAQRQVLGEDGESWNRRLQALGISVRQVSRALLDDPAVRRMFAASARAGLEGRPRFPGSSAYWADKS